MAAGMHLRMARGVGAALAAILFSVGPAAIGARGAEIDSSKTAKVFYSTEIWVGDANYITYQGANEYRRDYYHDGPLDIQPSEPFSLGTISATSFPEGEAATVDDVPFQIYLQASPVSPWGYMFGGMGAQYYLEGRLNGTITDETGLSDLTATMTSMQLLSRLNMDAPLAGLEFLGLRPRTVVTMEDNSQITTRVQLIAQVSAIQVPEPGALATLGFGLAAIAWRGIRRRRRRVSAA